MCDIMDDLLVYVPSHTLDSCQQWTPEDTCQQQTPEDTSQQRTPEDTSQQLAYEGKIEVVHPILLGGDQLTVARARGAQKLRSNEYTPSDRLEGLIPFSQDWHTFVAFLEVSKIWFSLISHRQNLSRGEN